MNCDIQKKNELRHSIFEKTHRFRGFCDFWLGLPAGTSLSCGISPGTSNFIQMVKFISKNLFSSNFGSNLKFFENFRIKEGKSQKTSKTCQDFILSQI